MIDKDYTNDNTTTYMEDLLDDYNNSLKNSRYYAVKGLMIGSVSGACYKLNKKHPFVKGAIFSLTVVYSSCLFAESYFLYKKVRDIQKKLNSK